MNIANLIPISPDEKVTSMIRVPEFDEEKYLVMVTRQGIIKRIELNAYNTSRKGGLIALELNEGDELAWVRMTDGNSQVIIATKKGMAIRFNETDIRAMGRQARGVKAMALKEGDCVVGMSVVREGGLVLTVSETGYGRLSSPDDYRVQSRGGKGLTNYHTENTAMLPLSRWLTLTMILLSSQKKALLSELPPNQFVFAPVLQRV